MKLSEQCIAHRLEDRISAINEKETKGMGGYRKGSGRPKGSKSAIPTKQIRVPYDIAVWLKHPGTITHVREMLQAYVPPNSNSDIKHKST